MRRSARAVSQRIRCCPTPLTASLTSPRRSSKAVGEWTAFTRRDAYAMTATPVWMFAFVVALVAGAFWLYRRLWRSEQSRLADVHRAELDAVIARQSFEDHTHRNAIQSLGLTTLSGAVTIMSLDVGLVALFIADRTHDSAAAGTPRVTQEGGSVTSVDGVALAQLVLAICDEGGSLAAHMDVYDRHRRQNPTLWEAIDAVLPGADPGDPGCANGLTLSSDSLANLAAVNLSALTPEWPPLEAALNALSATSM